ncbi:MAG: histidine kinase [Bacteroidota bacterium]
MSTAVTKTERFLRIGPFIIWFGMNTLITAAVWYQRDIFDGLYYLSTFFLFGTLVIWHFGYRLFPQYLESDGRLNSNIVASIVVNVTFFSLGIISHFFLVDILNILEAPHMYAPTAVRIVVWCLLVLLGMILMISIRLAEVYHMATVREMEDKVNRAESELMMLKNQISPHFLFNTLNNIYGLAYLGDDRTPEMISILSQIMRYLLYDCDQENVPLSNESALIDYYLALQILKYEDSVNVDYYKAGIQYNHIISPMILINYVENCFKHSDLEHNPEGWVNIHLEVDNNILFFRTENTIKKEMETVLFERIGIGLRNSMRILEANYPGKHTMKTDSTEGVYTVDLILEL